MLPNITLATIVPMFSSIAGAIILIIGIGAVVKAKGISNFEKRLVERHRWTKVTGWSGTPKGVLVWRILGAVFILEGLVLLQLAAYFHLHQPR